MRIPAHLGDIALAVRALMIAQVVLAVPELLYGLPMYGYLPGGVFPSRLAGTLVAPNSLGILAVVGLAFVLSFDERLRAASTLACLFLVAAAGSATGFVVLFVLGAGLLLQRSRGRRRTLVLAAVAAGGAILVAALPTIVGRTILFNSLFSSQGRVQRFAQAVSGPWSEVLLGQGLGRGSNTAANLRPEVLAGGTPLPPAPITLVSDSTVTFLVRGTGLIGAGLFYTLLLWAWRKDPRARPFYLAVGISSLTINVTELFPVNFLLALALAHTFSVAAAMPGLAGPRPLRAAAGTTG